MKVGTDGVLLGSWANVTGAQRILDVGTGTGLIALMLAQRTENTEQQMAQKPVQIHAIEIDRAAAQQAQENVANSTWHNRIQVYCFPLQTYVERCQITYDLIIANPPFFENAYKASNMARTVARHTDTLTLDNLLHAASQLLVAQGRICVIYPVEMAQEFLIQSQILGFSCLRMLRVKPTAQLPVKRILLDLMKNEEGCHQWHCQEETLVLEKHRHIYTPEFTRLVKDFYLKL